MPARAVSARCAPRSTSARGAISRQHGDSLTPERAAELRGAPGTGDFVWVGIHEPEPGDLTVHFADTLHTTPPPTAPDAGRRVLYIKYAEPKTFAWVPAGCHYNDALFHADAQGRVASRGATERDAKPYG